MKIKIAKTTPRLISRGKVSTELSPKQSTNLSTNKSNTLRSAEIEPQEAIILGRVVRDISAEETAFLLRTFQYDGIHLMASQEGQKFEDNILRVNPSSKEALTVSGLMSLGLLAPAEPTWDAPNVLRFTAIVARLIALVRAPDA